MDFASAFRQLATLPPLVGWGVFAVLIAAFLGLDLFLHRRAHTVHIREALIWSALWVGLALVFGLGVYLVRGPVSAMEFLAAYLIEESLSIDNLFVFLLLFSYFRVPAEYQHRVLFWGILGALAMRLVFIFAGVSLLQSFHWLVYLFGGVLVLSGIKMARQGETHIEPEKSLVLRTFRRFFPTTPGYVGTRFFVRQHGQLLATPLFVVVLMVETTDLVFAVDSIPAVLAISRDPFIVYTSNVFAILGLRSMFFALAGLMVLFHRLHHGLSLILVFVGAKMILSDVVHVPIVVTLIVVASVIVGSVLASLIWPRRTEAPPSPAPDPAE